MSWEYTNDVAKLRAYNYGIFDANLMAKSFNYWTQASPFQIMDRWEADNFKKLQKEKEMTAKNVQVAELKAEIAKLTKKLEKVEHGRWGKEPSNGAVFKIEKRFENGGTAYYYAAIKANGEWHLTGTGYAASQVYTWDELQSWAGKYSRVWVMTAREELVD
jgi:restriction endonuclease S subunit